MALRLDPKLLALAALALLAGGGGGAAGGAGDRPASGQLLLPPVRTAPRAFVDYMRQRLAAMRTALAGIATLPAAVAEGVVRSWLALWIAESGQHAEWNFNGGNLRPGNAWHGNVHVLPGAGLFRAYDSLEQAVDNFAHIMTSGRYRTAFGVQLVSPDDAGAWRMAILEAGFTPPPAGLDPQAWLRDKVVEIVSIRHRIDRHADADAARAAAMN
jgi:hypothetical protein